MLKLNFLNYSNDCLSEIRIKNELNAKRYKDAIKKFYQ